MRERSSVKEGAAQKEGGPEYEPSAAVAAVVAADPAAGSSDVACRTHETALLSLSLSLSKERFGKEHFTGQSVSLFLSLSLSLYLSP